MQRASEVRAAEPSGPAVLDGDALASRLPGSPSMPFYDRLNLLASWSVQCRPGAYLAAAFKLIIISKFWHLLGPASRAWVLVALAAALSDLAWRWSWPASYQRWRELPAAAIQLSGFGLPGVWMFLDELLRAHGRPAAGAAAHYAHLLFASGAAKMAALALALRVRLWLSALVLTTLVATSTRHTRALCATPPLAHPDGQAQTHGLFQLLRTLSGLLTASPPSVDQSSSVAECTVILSFLRLSLTLLLTLAWQALSEAQLFATHEAQRAGAGLPPERGAQAAVLRAAGALRARSQALHMMVLVLVLAGGWESCAACVR
eukprot:scaffold14.g1210.t1